MNVYIPLAIFLALFCFFMRQSEAQAKRAFMWSFFVAFIFAAIRYQFGPDYDSYWNIYDNIHGTDVSTYTSTGASAEKWFLYYLSIFPSYTAFIVVNTLLWFLANYIFLSKYAKGSDSWIIILYFFFNITYFRLSMVAMRSAMSAFIFIFALLIFLSGKKYSRLLFIALIIFAGQFHTSCLALAPLVFLTSKTKSFFFSPWLIVIAALIALSAFALGHNVVVDALGNFVVDNVDAMSRYAEEEGYEFGNVSGTLNSLIFMVANITIIYYLSVAGKKETDSVYVYIYKIAIIAGVVQLVFGQGMIQERFFMFFNPCYIVALIRTKYKSPQLFNMIIFVLIAASSLYFMHAKMSHNYSRSFLIYHTIFSAPAIP